MESQKKGRWCVLAINLPPPLSAPTRWGEVKGGETVMFFSLAWVNLGKPAKRFRANQLFIATQSSSTNTNVRDCCVVAINLPPTCVWGGATAAAGAGEGEESYTY